MTFAPPSGFNILGNPGTRIQFSESSCLHSLGKLVYPPLARSAAVQGLIYATLHLDVAGSIARSELEGHELLTEDVRRQISGVRIDGDRCGNRLPVTFIFRLVEPARAEPESMVVFQEPGTLLITATKPIPMID